MKRILIGKMKWQILMSAGLSGLLVLCFVAHLLKANKKAAFLAKKSDENIQIEAAAESGNNEYPSSQISKKFQAEGSRERGFVKVIFVGDLMLDRYNRQLINRNGVGWFTKEISSLFWGNDLSIANLEGVVSDNESLYNPNDLWDEKILRFTFDPEKSLRLLKDNNFNLVNLGNNHIDDFGASGFEQTLANLDRGNVGYFGDVSGGDINGKILEKNGMKIGFVSYNEFGGETASQVIRRIGDLRNKVDFLFVYSHWGKEYELEENDSQKQKARNFIDAGADTVVGSHPHVAQPIEIYKNKAIFYSLGNFIFDQYFSEDTKHMLALAVAVSEKDASFQLIPLYLQPNGQVVLADESKKNLLLERIVRSSGEVRQGVITAGSFNLSR